MDDIFYDDEKLFDQPKSYLKILIIHRHDFLSN